MQLKMLTVSVMSYSRLKYNHYLLGTNNLLKETKGEKKRKSKFFLKVKRKRDEITTCKSKRHIHKDL